MKHILIITTDEVLVEIKKPFSPLYGARYDHILVDAPKPTSERFNRWMRIGVFCRVKDSWRDVNYFWDKT